MRDIDQIVNDYAEHDCAYAFTPRPPGAYSDKQAARRYMDTYWLDDTEYRAIWKPLQDLIFVENALPEQRVFKDGFNMVPLRAGCIFWEEYFNRFSSLLTEIQETSFAIIQTLNDINKETPLMRFRYQWPISWGEINSGSYISDLMLRGLINDYCLIGHSGQWGRYKSNDATDLPWDLYFCKPELTPLFKKHLVPPDEDMEVLLSWLTEEYRELALKSGIRPVIGG